jgi:cholesterol oxidase
MGTSPVVIGTGFGGAVTACRLAQAGLEPIVLERGHRYRAGGFPRDTTRLDGWLWEVDGGLFDIRPGGDVMVIQAAGYGGGSLVYANVAYRPPDDVFDADSWLRDDGFCRAGLDPYYDLVASMLSVTPIDEGQPHGVPPKTLLMEKASAGLGRSEQTFRPNLAVDFGPAAPHVNRFGRQQGGCVHCAECDIGCNVLAKNTLDLNYLAVAEDQGAVVRCDTEVLRIARDDAEFIVQTRDGDGHEDELRSPHVFVCAGAVNSTELLLRSSAGLPALSDKLGQRYSGNGDLLGFAFGTAEDAPYLPTRGPVITTATVFDNTTPSNRVWFALEDGGYPKQLIELLQLINPLNQADLRGELVLDELGHLVNRDPEDVSFSLIEEADHTAVFLAMGRDHAGGHIDLIPGTGHAHVHWDVEHDLPLYANETAVGHDFAEEMGGTWVDNPGWRLMRQPLSVHNLGGCAMGATIADGVVGPDGGVFGVPGLFVIDGAILPAATGSNPSSTIAAVAELCVERAIRSITGDDTWHAPGLGTVQPPDLPEDRVVIPPGGTARPRTPAVGLKFIETMAGTLAWTETGAELIAGAVVGREVETDFRLTISTPSLVDFLGDSLHPASADGRVFVAGVTQPRDPEDPTLSGSRVTAGRFNLLTQTDSFYQREMLYSLPFLSEAGASLLMVGRKEVWDHGRFDVWPSTTTLYAELLDGSTTDRRVLAAGVLRLDLKMFATQLTTMRATGGGNPVRQVLALGGFVRYFAREMADVFLRSRVSW